MARQHIADCVRCSSSSAAWRRLPASWQRAEAWRRLGAQAQARHASRAAGHRFAGAGLQPARASTARHTRSPASRTARSWPCLHRSALSDRRGLRGPHQATRDRLSEARCRVRGHPAQQRAGRAPRRDGLYGSRRFARGHEDPRRAPPVQLPVPLRRRDAGDFEAIRPGRHAAHLYLRRRSASSAITAASTATRAKRWPRSPTRATRSMPSLPARPLRSRRRRRSDAR